LEASVELHHPIRSLTCYTASALMVLREGAETAQHCLGLRPESKSETENKSTVLSHSYLNILISKV